MVLFCAEDAGLDVAGWDGALEESALRTCRDRRVRIIISYSVSIIPYVESLEA